MDLMRMEQQDKETARALGIRYRQEGKGADAVLASPELQGLCRGRDVRGVRMLIAAFLKGHELQSRLLDTFGKNGTATFPSAAEAVDYLLSIPDNYESKLLKDGDKFTVTYQRREV